MCVIATLGYITQLKKETLTVIAYVVHKKGENIRCAAQMKFLFSTNKLKLQSRF
jgi:hypothetical protein